MVNFLILHAFKSSSLQSTHEFTLPYQGYQHGIPLSALLPGAGHAGELARTTTGSWPTASKRSFF